MTSINDFITSIITEAALDSRIPDGVVDLKNIEHVQIIAEAIYNACEDEDLVNEFVRSFLNEGKYPDRQAFNKEGWLVTFPSKEYRDAAIKKGTHSIADPTHGKGGMNLYYKRRGKQKRQTQQQATQVVQKEVPPQRKLEPQQTQPKDQSKTGETEPQTAGETPLATPTKAPPVPSSTADSKPTEEPEPKSPPIQTPPPEAGESPQVPKPVDSPAIDVPVVEKPAEQYANISKKFATQKGWKEEPYGEWRSVDGETMAVVGLSGEIVPVKSVYRDEYKLFAEKNIM